MARFDVLITSAIKAPRYLQEVGWKSPTEPHDGFFQYANQTKLGVFDFLLEHPSLFADFNLFMGNTMGTRKYWCDWYKVEERLLTGFDSRMGSVLLVDVGGGKGHDLQAFHEKFGTEVVDRRGKLILQELKAVIDGINAGQLSTDIKLMEHDFFATQPIKGKNLLRTSH